MRLLIDVSDYSRTIILQKAPATKTLAELIRQTHSIQISGHPLYLDVAEVGAATKLADLPLLDGSLISDKQPRNPLPSRWEVLLSGGLAAGARIAVTGKLIVGRAPESHIRSYSPSTSWIHAALVPEGEGVRVFDMDSANGTYLDGVAVSQEGELVTTTAVVTAGGISLVIRERQAEAAVPKPGSQHNISAEGTVPFNRPPRPGRAPEPEAIEQPERKQPPEAAKFSWASFLAPLIMAVALMVLMGNARYGMIALLSPVLAVATWVEQKRRAKKNAREETGRFGKSMLQFKTEIEEAVASQRKRLWQQLPDPAWMIWRACQPSVRLWQRRADAKDFLAVHLGIADLKWKPQVVKASTTKLEPEIKQVLEQVTIPAAPVGVELTGGGVVGIVGPRNDCLAVARSLLLQATVHAGPADLSVAIFCERGREEAWQWAKWLPHLRRHVGGGYTQWASSNRERSESLARAILENSSAFATPTVLALVDSEALLEGREAPVRELLGHGRNKDQAYFAKAETAVSGIVIAATERALPAACTAIVRVGEDASAQVFHPADLSIQEDVLLAGIRADVAEQCARNLAHFEDPELALPGGTLPQVVNLLSLLAPGTLDAAKILADWKTNAGVGAPVGVSEEGSFALDLVRDGPHGLVGGTTGSGKSEFLRTLVASLAARIDPDHLTFILIDFKGGAAFKTCEALPHTIGTVSNLDQQLANRAIRALEAEMRYRQEVFAAAGEGIDNLDAYLATNPAQPMPRLVLVVDEFAQLAKEYPDVLSSLVSIAAVGRTLGVHMVLATQRPAGVVNEDILANTNLRVALRVQSRDDSNYVIGTPSASTIDRTQRGRAYVKLGEGDITPIQTALSTGTTGGRGQEELIFADFAFGVDVALGEPDSPAEQTSNDLERLIETIGEAARQGGYARPRPVWPPALEANLRLPIDKGQSGEVAIGSLTNGNLSIGLSDDPDRQRQIPASWDMDRGNVLLAGIPGSGITTALSSIALSLCAQHSPEELDLAVLDMGAGQLQPLAKLPHTVAYVGPGAAAGEMRERFIKYLARELTERKREPAGRKLVVILDGLAALREEFSDYVGLELLDLLYRVYADGQALGIHFALGTSRIKAVPSAIDDVTTQKWLFQLADPYDYSFGGIGREQIPSKVPGRCVLAENGLQTQIARYPEPIEQAVASISSRWPNSAKLQAVGALPHRVSKDQVVGSVDLATEPYRIPIGIAEEDMSVSCLQMYEGEHALIAGPPRSGKSSVLLTVAQGIREGFDKLGIPGRIYGVGGRRTPLAQAKLDGFYPFASCGELWANLLGKTIPTFVLVDDAEQLDPAGAQLEGLVKNPGPFLHFVVAGRADDLRSNYGHWNKQIRRSRLGILLQPNVDYDGELLGVKIPRRSPVALTTARGYMCLSGIPTLVQCAT